MEHNSMEVDGLDHFSFETWVMAVGSSRSSSWVFFYLFLSPYLRRVWD